MGGILIRSRNVNKTLFASFSDSPEGKGLLYISARLLSNLFFQTITHKGESYVYSLDLLQQVA